MIPLSKTTLLRRSFAEGQRVKAHPATDIFMRGDVYGTVIKIGAKHIHVRMDRSDKVRKFHPANLLPVS